jgi:hypothetical protein
MRSRQLETEITRFVEDAAARLRADLAAGAEVPFELAASGSAPGARTALYCYCPLTGAFIEERWGALTELESYAAAERLLECLQGLDRYLIRRDVRIGRGERGARPGVVLRTLLEEIFEEQSDFELCAERLRGALAELDAAAFTNAGEVALIETLHGLGTVAPELAHTRAPAIGRPELAWALARFEMGCERSSELEALSDYLLALRALLEPEGPASGLLAGRLAAICATPAERAGLTRRTFRAIELEREVIRGAAVEHPSCAALVSELAGNLRALLRDVVCGHLPPDLVGLADELLAPQTQTAQGGAHDAQAQTAEVTARRGRGRRAKTPSRAAVPSEFAAPARAPAPAGAEASSGEEVLGDAVESGEILNVPV